MNKEIRLIPAHIRVEIDTDYNTIKIILLFPYQIFLKFQLTNCVKLS